MKGSEAKLLEYMEGAKKRFIIPVYQRNYDWKKDNCKQLFGSSCLKSTHEAEEFKSHKYI